MINQLIIFVGQDLFFLLPVLVAIIFFQLPSRKRTPYVASLALGGILALVLAKLASHMFFDPRPFMSGQVTALFPHSPGNGFPSDHTTYGITLALVSFAYSRKWGWVMILIAIAVGAARVLAHVHSWIDILGGIGVGLIATSAAIIIIRVIENKMPARQNGEKANAR